MPEEQKKHPLEEYSESVDREILPISSYFLLRSELSSRYKGIDRDPFVPLLLDKEMTETPTSDHPSISDFYPPSWRKDAYLVYEKNCITWRDEQLLHNLAAAFGIRRIIEPYVGPHQVVQIEATPLDRSDLFSNDPETSIRQGYLGLDVAYPGGDFYSAVRNGLFFNPSSVLLREFESCLNGNGLFTIVSDAQRYLTRFRQVVVSEINSEF